MLESFRKPEAAPLRMVAHSLLGPQADKRIEGCGNPVVRLIRGIILPD